MTFLMTFYFLKCHFVSNYSSGSPSHITCRGTSLFLKFLSGYFLQGEPFPAYPLPGCAHSSAFKQPPKRIASAVRTRQKRCARSFPAAMYFSDRTRVCILQNHAQSSTLPGVSRTGAFKYIYTVENKSKGYILRVYHRHSDFRTYGYAYTKRKKEALALHPDQISSAVKLSSLCTRRIHQRTQIAQNQRRTHRNRLAGHRSRKCKAKAVRPP